MGSAYINNLIYAIKCIKHFQYGEKWEKKKVFHSVERTLVIF